MVISCFNHAPPLSFTILQGTIPNFSKTHQIPKLKLNPSLTFLPHRLRHDSFTSPHRRRQSPSRPAVTRKPPLAPSAQATDRRSQTLSVAVGRTLLSVSRQPPSVAYTAVRSRCYPSNHYIAASRSAAPIPIKGGGSAPAGSASGSASMPRRKRATTRLWGTAPVIHTAKKRRWLVRRLD